MSDPASARKARLAFSKWDAQESQRLQYAAEVRQNADRLRAMLGARKSGKSNLLPRRDEVRDREIVKEIQASLWLGASVRLVSRKAPRVITRKVPITSSQWKRIRREIRKERKTHPSGDTWIRTFWVPAWDHTGDKLKALSWAMVLSEGNGLTISLRLGSEVITRATSYKKGFARYIQERLQTELRKRFAPLGLATPDFFVAIEVPAASEVHVHGAVSTPETTGYDAESERGFRLARKNIRAALKAVGGDWIGPSGTEAGRQVHTVQLDTAFRWVSYTTKWAGWAEWMLGSSPVAATQGLKRRGKAWYMEACRSGFVVDGGEHWRDQGLIAVGAD